tara:strand:- start:8460 stop:8813 length:354 start_codon:yes stop_codon:yes gene_type:complete
MSIAKGAIKGISAAMRAVGGTITYRKVTTGIYNSSSGSMSENVTDFNLKGVVSNVTKSEVSELVSTQDKRLTISAGDITFTPTTFDRVTISGTEYKVIQINTNEQDNTAISFDIFLR